MDAFALRILRDCFRRFKYDSRARRVVPNLIVSPHLHTIGQTEYHLTYAAADEIIQRTLNSISLLTESETLQELRLSALRSYTIIGLTHSGGQQMTLLSIDSLRMLVVEDTTKTLQTGDILRCIDFVFTTGNGACFQAMRNDIPYPDDSHLIRLPLIEGIVKFQLAHIPFRNEDYGNMRTHTKAMSCVKCWQCQAQDGNFYFMPQHFTTHNGSLFCIDLGSLTYSINPNFEQSLYQKGETTYMDYLKPVCNYCVAGDDEERRQTIKSGTLDVVYVNGSHYALKVCDKADIKL